MKSNECRGAEAPGFPLFSEECICLIRVQNDSSTFQRLDEILRRIESAGAASLTSDQVLAFGPLYRRAVSELSAARAQGVDDSRIEYLNALVSRAYGHIYVQQPKGWPSIIGFFMKEFPQTLRRNLQFVATAFLISLVAAGFAFGVVSRDPGKADTVLGPRASEMIEEISERHAGHRNWMPEQERPVMSSFIITNNIQVAALAFATGIAAGAGTFFVLFYNGLMLGTIAAGVKTKGAHVAWGFWSFVAPHGVIELTAIFIAGGAGLMLGWALLCPGSYTRKVALKLAGREAFKLLLGVAAMLLVAGLIEGFFSPSMLPNAVKLTVAGMLWVLLYSYLFLAGRRKGYEVIRLQGKGAGALVPWYP